MITQEKLDTNEFERVPKTDIYLVGLLLPLAMLDYIYIFSRGHIRASDPRNLADKKLGLYGSLIVKALRRHVTQ